MAHRMHCLLFLILLVVSPIRLAMADDPCVFPTIVKEISFPPGWQGMPYAWNPYDAGPYIVFSNEDMTITSGVLGYSACRATIPRSEGRYYFEVYVQGQYHGVSIECANSVSQLYCIPGSCYPGIDTNSLAYAKQAFYWDADFWYQSAEFRQNQTVGVAVDLDSNTYSFYIDGSFIFVRNVPLSHPVFPLAAVSSDGGKVAQVTLLSHDDPRGYPPPAGYTHWGAAAD
jgi:hypothetical protein